MSWTPLELAANFMTVVCIFLAGRNNVHTWWTGIVACILFGFLFFSSQLYADVTLQVFFVITGIIGWIGWSKSKLLKPLEISKASGESIMTYLLVALIASLVYGFILHLYTDAYAPFIDSFVLSLSVVAQLLLMRRQLQTWMFWLAVNTLAVPLFWSRELYLTSILYAAFWIHAIWAWNHWAKLYAETKPQSNKIWNS